MIRYLLVTKERVDLTKYFFGEREFPVFPHCAVCATHTVDFTKFLYHNFLKNFRENNFLSKEFTI